MSANLPLRVALLRLPAAGRPVRPARCRNARPCPQEPDIAYHATPLLPWGQPLPSYPHERVTGVDAAVALVQCGERVHVDTEDQVVQVLRRLGLTEDAIQV